jgi:hypothetical protein
MLDRGFIKVALRALDGIDSEILFRCAENEGAEFLALPSELASLNFNLCKEGV